MAFLAGEGSGGDNRPPESEGCGEGGKAGEANGRLLAGDENEELFSLKFFLYVLAICSTSNG